MKYTVNIEINLPRSKVVELIDNPNHLKEWQEGLVSFEPLEGTPGEKGSKSKIIYQMGKRRIEMVETIDRRDLPEHFDSIYEADGMWNKVSNTFKEINENRTLWISDNEFVPTSFLLKVIMLIMPGSFKKQSLKYLTDFKAFAEGYKE